MSYYRDAYWKKVRELKQARDNCQSAEVKLCGFSNPYLVDTLYASYTPDSEMIVYRLEHDEHVHNGMGRELVVTFEARVASTLVERYLRGCHDKVPEILWSNDPSVLELEHFIELIEEDIILFEDLFWRWGVEKPRWPIPPLWKTKRQTLREPKWVIEERQQGQEKENEQRLSKTSTNFRVIKGGKQ